MSDEAMNGTRSVWSGVGCGHTHRDARAHASVVAASGDTAGATRRLLASLGVAAAIAVSALALLPDAALTAPAAQGTAPGAPPAATPTMTADERLQERQLDKLTFEIRVLQQQEESLKQERVVGEWRAIASTLAEFGQLAIGLGLLVVLARGLERWLGRDQRMAHRYGSDEPEVERGV